MSVPTKVPLRRGVGCAAAILLSAACASGGSRTAEPPAPVAAAEPSVAAAGDSAAYHRLLDRLRGGDLGVSFDSLRLGYAATGAFDPYGVDRDRRQAMFGALERGDHAAARAAADSALEENYTDAFAHIAASIAASAAGDSAAGAFHRDVARGLLGSIAAGGGHTPDSAMVVISVDEEYALLEAMGLQRETQGLMDCAGRPCDALTVVNPRTGEKSVLYFDVSIPMGWMSRKMAAP